ncbi:hypothetical protein BKA70DRAFT_1223836 [Coprinopsis sp. MPI-PUGE-AT-0042]|nr:hypothetical protein BKA70DRAFT_1223836 [Coprinopsis sp. MPI-PUGE-AT-0042]
MCPLAWMRPRNKEEEEEEEEVEVEVAATNCNELMALSASSQPFHENNFIMDLNLEAPSALIPTRREQLRELEASIAVVDERISLSEAQVRALLFALEALKGECSGLQDRKSALILAPSRQLPNELLSSIFQSAMDQTRFMDEEDRETLTNIRRVCKHWDSVARKTPGLWRNLYIGIEKRCRSTNVLAFKVHNWLFLGGVGAPLRLSLRCEVHPYSEPAELTFLTVLTQPWNWTEIHLNLGISCLLALLRDIAEEDFKPYKIRDERLRVGLEVHVALKDSQERARVLAFANPTR